MSTTMNCHTARDLVCEFLEGDLPAARREAFENHIAVCESCREETEVMRAAFEALAESPRPELTDGFTDKLMESLPPRESIVCQEKRRRVAGRLALASLLLVSFLSWNFLLINFYGQVNRSTRLMLSLGDATMLGTRYLLEAFVALLSTAAGFVRTLTAASHILLDTPLAHQAYLLLVFAVVCTLTLIVLHRRRVLGSSRS